MKRTIGALVLTLGIILGIVAPPVQVAHAAPRIKDCAYIQFAAGDYATQGGTTPFLGVQFDAAAPVCKKVVVTLTVRTLQGVVIGSASRMGDGTWQGDQFGVIPTGTPTEICAELTTSSGAKPLDRAPTDDAPKCDATDGGTYFLLDGGTGAGRMR